MFKYVMSFFSKKNKINAQYSCGLPIGTETIGKDMYPFLFLSTNDRSEARAILKSGKAHQEVMAIVSDYVKNNPKVANNYKVNDLYYDLGDKGQAPNEFRIKLYARRCK